MNFNRLIILFNILIIFSLSFVLGCAQLKNIQFSDSYKEINRGKISIEIPEVHELINIMLVISDRGLENPNMINKKSEYYQEVINKFSKYKFHKAVKRINKKLSVEKDFKSSIYYNAYRINSCGYILDNKNHIVSDHIINKMGYAFVQNSIKKNKKSIQNFSDISNFKDFYLTHEIYYNQLIKNYAESIPIKEMWNWLESKFPIKYDYLRIIISPLTGNSHITKEYEKDEFKQIVIFGPIPKIDTNYNRYINQMINSKMVFTEIDHNYVNPISDKFDEIYSIYKNKNFWASKYAIKFYNSEMRIFNEYMTWAIFSLYCYDNFPENEVNSFIEIMEDQMINNRGFYRFRDFNQKLIQIYKDDKNLNIEEIYKKMLDWSKSNNTQI